MLKCLYVLSGFCTIPLRSTFSCRRKETYFGLRCFFFVFNPLWEVISSPHSWDWTAVGASENYDILKPCCRASLCWYGGQEGSLGKLEKCVFLVVNQRLCRRAQSQWGAPPWSCTAEGRAWVGSCECLRWELTGWESWRSAGNAEGGGSGGCGLLEAERDGGLCGARRSLASTLSPLAEDSLEQKCVSGSPGTQINVC